MNNRESKFNRGDLFKAGGAALAGAAALGTLGGNRLLADGGSSLSCGGGQVIEVFPSSPLILAPCTDGEMSRWSVQPGETGKQDSRGADHQIWPTSMGMPKPLVYNIKLQV